MSVAQPRPARVVDGTYRFLFRSLPIRSLVVWGQVLDAASVDLLDGYLFGEGDPADDPVLAVIEGAIADLRAELRHREGVAP